MRPVPAWFWVWARWYLGRSEFKGHARDPKLRPASAPKLIPAWAWVAFRTRFLSRPKPSIWSLNGLFIVNLNADGTVNGTRPYEWAIEAKAAGFQWVCVQILYGATPVNLDHDLDIFFREVRRAGLKAGAWGFHSDDPAGEAKIVRDVQNVHTLDLYAANCEELYKAISGGASKSWSLATLLPKVPLAWFTYADPRPMPISTWLEYGDVVTECYWNEMVLNRPADSAAQAHDAGVPASRLHVCYGVHSSKLTISPAQYKSDTPAEVRGYSLYPAEVADLSAWH